MNKSELLSQVAGDAGVSKGDAEKVVQSFFDTVTAQAKKGNKVSWPGFGSFSTTKRKARTGRNPQTGKSMKIPASTAMKFSAASGLKETLNSAKGAKKRSAKKKAGAKKRGARRR